MNKTRFGWIVAAVVITVFATGCANWERRTSRHRTNNLYKFLYPEGSLHVDAPTIPTLTLPMRVGVAFVPDEKEKNSYYYDEFVLSETHKAALLKKVSDQFKSYPFVSGIEIIPTAYLTPKGGFANLDQLRTMYNVDVIALFSYDQTQYTDEGLLSLTYWTIIGAYVIPGEKNDTRTMLDGAVYDVASRKLLFRAPGVSAIKNSSALVNQSQSLRESSEKGFEIAATNLVTELKVQLAQFQERVKNAPAEYNVVKKPGYAGAGAFGNAELALMGCAGLCFLIAQREKRS